MKDRFFLCTVKSSGRISKMPKKIYTNWEPHKVKTSCKGNSYNSEFHFLLTI